MVGYRSMDLVHVLREALLAYVFFIPLLTFHEWAHAWTAWKCGDETARKLGRVSLNPIVHMDLVGTVILPLLGILSSAVGAGVVIGWGKPVPVNPNNLKHPRAQDCLIAMAGPAMNIVLALVLLAFTKAMMMAKQQELADVASQMAMISLFLCFFNLMPIPPLDGSHLLMNLVRMSYQTYVRLSLAGFVVVIVLMQLKPVRNFLINVVKVTFDAMAKLFHLA